MSVPPPLDPLPPAAPPAPAPVARGWWSRHWKWAVPLIALLLGLLLLASIAVFFFGIASMTKSSEPYRHGVATAQHDARVRAALGDPVKDGFMPSGSINTTNGSGQAEFSVSLSGPRGTGTLYIEAERHAGQWHYSTLQVAPDDGSEAIVLLEEQADAGGEWETDAESDPEMDAEPQDAAADADVQAAQEAPAQ